MIGAWEPGWPTRSRPWRLLRGAVVAVLVLVLIFFAGGGWFYSGEIRAGALDSKAPDPPALGTEVLAVGDGSVTLARDPGSPRELTLPGTWGLRWADGYGRLGAVLAQGPDRVERAFTRLEGTPPRAGEVGRRGLRLPGRPGPGRQPAGPRGHLPLAARPGGGLAGRGAATPG